MHQENHHLCVYIYTYISFQYNEHKKESSSQVLLNAEWK